MKVFLIGMKDETPSEWQTKGNTDMKQLDAVAAILVIVGALNWGLVAVARFDLVAAIFGMQFGETSAITSVVYALVGLAGLYQAGAWKGIQRRSYAAPASTR